MTKPFDFADLLARVEAKGLPLTEQVAKVIVTCVIDWTEDSLKAETNPLFAYGVGLVELMRNPALAMVDKIDGVTGN